MINHDLKCIFVHIPRTGGTSVEHWLCGKDWWQIDRASKHLTARQARALYADHWDSYFKFSIVRHPLTRVASQLHHAAHFGLTLGPEGAIDLAGYRALFGQTVIVEHDYRFHDLASIRHSDHASGQVYGNILDCPLDFVARFETLAEDMDHVRRRLGLTDGLAVRLGRSSTPDRAVQAALKARAEIGALYARDLGLYGYDVDSVAPGAAAEG